MTRNEVRKKLSEYIAAHPELTYPEIAAKLGCSRSTVSNCAREFNIIRQRRALSEADLAKLENTTDGV